VQESNPAFLLTTKSASAVVLLTAEEVVLKSHGALDQTHLKFCTGMSGKESTFVLCKSACATSESARFEVGQLVTNGSKSLEFGIIVGFLAVASKFTEDGEVANIGTITPAVFYVPSNSIRQPKLNTLKATAKGTKQPTVKQLTAGYAALKTYIDNKTYRKVPARKKKAATQGTPSSSSDDNDSSVSDNENDVALQARKGEIARVKKENAARKKEEEEALAAKEAMELQEEEQRKQELMTMAQIRKDARERQVRLLQEIAEDRKLQLDEERQIREAEAEAATRKRELEERKRILANRDDDSREGGPLKQAKSNGATQGTGPKAVMAFGILMGRNEELEDQEDDRRIQKRRKKRNKTLLAMFDQGQ